LPPHLRRDSVTVETFVAWDEPIACVGEDPPYLTFRRLRAWRRWQDAVEGWGAERALDVRQLRALGFWPVSPPRFGDPSRLTGQRFY
jgi:hypothetical protein